MDVQTDIMHSFLHGCLAPFIDDESGASHAFHIADRFPLGDNPRFYTGIKHPLNFFVKPYGLGHVTHMRAIILLILSCASLVAADTSVQVFSSVSTNGETGAILTTETFTRSGQTNLVRITKSHRGVVVFRTQQFCHRGEPVALFTFRENIESFHTVPNTPYHVDLEFLPSKDVRCLMIQGRDFIDGFYPTNGVYYPAPDSDLEMKPVKQ